MKKRTSLELGSRRLRTFARGVGCKALFFPSPHRGLTSVPLTSGRRPLKFQKRTLLNYIAPRTRRVVENPAPSARVPDGVSTTRSQESARHTPHLGRLESV